MQAPTLLLFLQFWLSQGQGLKCYSDLEGKHWTQCDEKKGFRTCFTKYDFKGEVTGRGCSTKDKIFHIECENHVMGRQSEKFCYCSYFLCNASGQALLSRPLLLLSLLLLVTSCWVSSPVMRTLGAARRLVLFEILAT